MTVKVIDEMINFLAILGVGIDEGPSTYNIIATCKICKEWSHEDRMRLGYLAIYIGFIEGQKT